MKGASEGVIRLRRGIFTLLAALACGAGLLLAPELLPSTRTTPTVKEANASMAVPSFSRQLGLPCSACHTHPPRLNATGRDFKLQGYRASTRPLIRRGGSDDQGQDANIFENFPFSARLLGDLQYDAEPGSGISVGPSDAGRLYASGRLTDHIGIHVQLLGGRGVDAQVTLAERVGDWTVALTGGHTGPARADAYGTISRGMGFPAERALVNSQLGDRGDLRAGALRNRGVGGMAYLYGRNVFAGAGFFDTSGNESPSEPWVRVVYETPVAGSSHVGAFWFDSDSHDYLSGSGTDQGRRYGLDVAVQRNLGDGWLVDLMGVLVVGRNTLRGVTEAVQHGRADLTDTSVEHRGWNLGVALHRGSWAAGATYGEYRYRGTYATVDGVVEAHGNTVLNPFVSWMFASNARLGLDLRMVRDGRLDDAWPHLRLRYDIGF